MIIAFIGNNGKGETTVVKEMGKSWLGKMGTNAVKAREKTIFELIEKESKRGNKTKLLGLGCSNGNFTLAASRKVGGEVDICGFDISKKSLNDAQSKGINTVLYDLNKELPLKAHSCDIIVSDQVIEHLTNPETFIKEVYRVLKPGGYAIISTENLSSWNNLLALLFGYGPPPMHYSDEKNISGIPLLSPNYGKTYIYDYPPHVKLFTRHVLKELFKIHGFQIEKLTGGGYYPVPKFLMRMMSKIDPTHSPYITIKIRKPDKERET